MGSRSSASETIDGRSEYQVQHNVAPDISRRYVARTEQTNKQAQRILKQDEKQSEDIQKEKKHTIKSRPEEQATQQQA
jgi:hypothetical protein